MNLAISAALDDGVELSGLAEVVPTVQVVFDPGTQCVSGSDLGQLPPELTEAIRPARA